MCFLEFNSYKEFNFEFGYINNLNFSINVRPFMCFLEINSFKEFNLEFG